MTADVDVDLDLDLDWYRHVFLLLGPDAVARHLVEPILDRAAAIDLVPAAYHPIPFPWPELDQLYEHHIRTIWDAYRFRLVDMLFAYGPMMVVVLADTRGDGSDPHARFKEIKGDSDPAKAAPGTIRRDLWSINVTMSLVHASDSPEAAATEIPHFLAGATPAPGGAGEVVALCRLMAPGPAETRRFDEVLGGLRARLAAAAFADLSSAGRDLVLRASVVDLAATGFGAAIVEHLRGGDGHPLAPALAAEFLPGHPRLEVGRLRHLAAAFGVTVDRWEELVLTTSSTWMPRRISDG